MTCVNRTIRGGNSFVFVIVIAFVTVIVMLVVVIMTVIAPFGMPAGR